MSVDVKSFREVLDELLVADPEFAAQWGRTQIARDFAVALIRYRQVRELRQRELAEQLGVGQWRVCRMEEGEHNPSIDKLIDVAQRLGWRIVIEIDSDGSNHLDVQMDRPRSKVDAQERPS